LNYRPDRSLTDAPLQTELRSAFEDGETRLSVEAIARAAELIRAGRLVAFPTETVYGLGANALDAAAVARIYEAKGRPSNNPIIVHVAGVEAAKLLVAKWPEIADRLAAAFWPGPLTLILPKKDLVADIVTGGGPTVAIRMPAHPVALALLEASGVPIAAPSANRSTQLSPTTAAHVLQSLEGRVELILDGGPTTGGIESTVLSLAGEQPQILRPGLITGKQIESVIGPIAHVNPGGRPQAERTNAQSTIQHPQSSGPSPEALPSPGMLERHYAPFAPLEISNCGDRRVRELLAEGHNVGWLTHCYPSEELRDNPMLEFVQMPEDAADYAARMYAELHQLDDLGVSCIVVDELPQSDEWIALRDRLSRAATPESG